MQSPNRRTFLNVAGLAAGSGLVGAASGGALDLFAQAPAQSVSGIPDEILNPVEVSGAEAVPVIGRLPGERRMYVLRTSRRASTIWSAVR